MTYPIVFRGTVVEEAFRQFRFIPPSPAGQPIPLPPINATVLGFHWNIQVRQNLSPHSGPLQEFFAALKSAIDLQMVPFLHLQRIDIAALSVRVLNSFIRQNTPLCFLSGPDSPLEVVLYSPSVAQDLVRSGLTVDIATSIHYLASRGIKFNTVLPS